jgi:peptidoglycan-associated lipoprotein
VPPECFLVGARAECGVSTGGPQAPALLRRAAGGSAMARHSISMFLLAGAMAAGCAHKEESAKPVTASNAYVAPAPKKQAPMETPKSEPAAPVASGKPEDAIYFDFDSSLVRDDARPVLQEVGAKVKEGRQSLKVEGNCDEVGTVEYNIALGEARARAAKEYLVHLGVPARRITIASYGSQRPRDPGHDEAAHAKNRRDDLLVR